MKPFEKKTRKKYDHCSNLLSIDFTHKFKGEMNTFLFVSFFLFSLLFSSLFFVVEIPRNWHNNPLACIAYDFNLASFCYYYYCCCCPGWNVIWTAIYHHFSDIGIEVWSTFQWGAKNEIETAEMDKERWWYFTSVDLNAVNRWFYFDYKCHLCLNVKPKCDEITSYESVR